MLSLGSTPVDPKILSDSGNFSDAKIFFGFSEWIRQFYEVQEIAPIRMLALRVDLAFHQFLKKGGSSVSATYGYLRPAISSRLVSSTPAENFQYQITSSK